MVFKVKKKKGESDLKDKPQSSEPEFTSNDHLTKSTLELNEKYDLVSLFDGISTFVGYLMPKPWNSSGII